MSKKEEAIKRIKYFLSEDADVPHYEDMEELLKLLESEPEPTNYPQDKLIEWLRSDAIPLAIQDGCNKAADEIDRMTAELKAKDDLMNKIQNWCEAYPLEVFPKSDMEKAAQVLKEAGMTLDSISAENMRHVISGVKGIIKQEKKSI